MRKKRTSSGGAVSMRVIRRFAHAVAAKFQPEKIILFGSYSRGAANPESDVDILVVMPARNQLDQACKIRRAVPAPFPMDLIVRTPASMAWRLAERESFLTQIMAHGKILYEKDDARVGAEGARGLARRSGTSSKKAASA